MRESQAFWDGIAAKYAKSPVRDMEAYDRTMERSRDWLTSGDDVLELGCGTGTTALRLADAVGRITATDISGNMVEIAQAKAREQGVANVEFRRTTAFDQSLDGQAFDVVLAYNLLHLVEDLPGVIARSHSLLKPGGRFISKTVCMGEANPLWRIALFAMQAIGKAPYLNFLKIGELESAVREAGFEILETGNYPASPPSRFIVARKL